MASEVFRLVRMLPADCSVEFDYLSSYSVDDRFEFSQNPQEAVLFHDWNTFVDVACSLWRSQGPMDIVYERVFFLSRRSVSHA